MTATTATTSKVYRVDHGGWCSAAIEVRGRWISTASGIAWQISQAVEGFGLDCPANAIWLDLINYATGYLRDERGGSDARGLDWYIARGVLAEVPGTSCVYQIACPVIDVTSREFHALGITQADDHYDGGNR